MPPDGLKSSHWRWFLLIAALGVVLRIGGAFYFQGIHHPDEHQQYMEQAFRFVHGFGATFWEQERGMRHPAFHTFLAGLLATLETARIDNPLLQASLIRLAVSFVVFAALAWLAWDFCKRGEVVVGLSLMIAFALCMQMVYINTRTLSENAMIAPLAVALILGRRRPLIAGIMLGLMFALRTQSMLLTLAIGLVTLLEDAWHFRQHRSFARTLKLSAGIGAGLLLVGAWDFVEFGQWFHSSIENVRANLVEGRSDDWGILPFRFYFASLPARLSEASVFAVPLIAMGAWRQPKLAFVAFVFVLGHSLIRHKEPRFIWGVFPILYILAAYGFDWLWRAWTRRGTLAALAVASILIGSSASVPPRDRIVRPFIETAYLLERVRHETDIKGVAILDTAESYSANYFYLTKPLPIAYFEIGAPDPLATTFVSVDDERASNFNYLIGPTSRYADRPDMEQVANFRAWSLWRVTR